MLSSTVRHPRRLRVTAASLPAVIPAVALAVALAVSGAMPGLAAGEQGTAPPGNDPCSLVDADSLMATVRELASDRYAGRLAGSEGYAAAARWAAARMAALGLRPGGQDGYRQPFPIELNEIDACRLAVVGPEGERELRLGDDFVCRGFSGSGRVTAPVVFVGYGVADSALGYDDYADVDVAGQVVLAFKPAPAWKPAEDRGWGDAGLPRVKSRLAAAHGAVALLLVDPPPAEPEGGDDGNGEGDEREPRPPIGSVLHGPGEQAPDFPQMQVSEAVAAQLLAGSGETLPGLRAAIDGGRAPRPLALTARVSLAVDARHDAAHETANLVGLLPGADLDLADEVLVVGAHLDHVGRQGDGRGGHLLFPGANDNASGSAAVLEIARALAAGGFQPRRTVAFVLFAGEEQGLNGARWYVDHPALPLARTVAMLNLDCVAAGDSVQVGGGKSSPRLWEIARAAAAGPGLMVERTWRGGGADASPFFDEGVPTLYFHTVHGYGQLHQPADAPQTLAPAVFAELTRIACSVVRAVATGGYEGEAAAPEVEPVGHP